MYVFDVCQIGENIYEYFQGHFGSDQLDALFECLLWSLCWACLVKQKMKKGSAAVISYELNRPVDKHSRYLIASTIELFPGYCVRFYDRQYFDPQSAR